MAFYNHPLKPLFRSLGVVTQNERAERRLMALATELLSYKLCELSVEVYHTMANTITHRSNHTRESPCTIQTISFILP